METNEQIRQVLKNALEEELESFLEQVGRHQCHFAKAGRGRGRRLGSSVDDHRSTGDPGHRCLLERRRCVFPSQRGTFLFLLARG